MGEYFIHTDQMVVGYDGKPLIKDVEIKMKRGEILTLTHQTVRVNLRFLRA